jgi:cytochrome c
MRVKTCASIAIPATCLIAIAGSAFAQQGPASPQRGHELAVRLCTNCHAIDRETSGPMRADIPSFPAIANRPGATAEHLAGRIIAPHPAMPGVPLTAAEIRDIVAYIVALKGKD